ncbi:CHAT domain-containing tetratricopeptide repeat protein [Zavarzinia aquatilis]|uniref:CHAT domain-containing protein n=1 Tax=Zavarzinia aquatilis TaxID=2211142 RepID=A0A317DU66_9PROT|nr:CHAT domain-containing tetratricopeptide repeat protein [Zavarzinia aquatilis]PWR17924.1 hypothetical protein DKG74_20165 [Zavarzinia aquatilis]
MLLPLFLSLNLMVCGDVLWGANGVTKTRVLGFLLVVFVGMLGMPVFADDAGRGGGEGGAALEMLQDRVRQAYRELRYEDAARLAQEALDAPPMQATGYSGFTANLLDLARALIGWGYVEEAIARLDEAQRLTNASTVTGELEIAEVHAVRATALVRLQQWPAALEEIERAGAIWQRHLPPDHMDRGRYALERGEILLRLKRFGEAEVAARDALAIYESAVEPKWRGTEDAARNLSWRKEYGRLLGYGYSIALLIDSMIGQGRGADADREFLSLLTSVYYAHKSSYFPDEILFIRRYAGVYHRLGRPENVEIFFRDAFKYWSENNLLGHHEAIDLTIDLGGLLIDTGKAGEARRLLNEALLRAEMARPQDPLQISALLKVLARATADQPEVSAAFRERAREYAPADDSVADRKHIADLVAEGDRLMARAAIAAAEERYRAALERDARAGVPDPGQRISILLGLARSALARKNVPACERYVLEAEKLYEEKNIRDEELYIGIRVAKARLLLARGDFDGAGMILGMALARPDAFGSGDSPGAGILSIFEGMLDSLVQQGSLIEAARQAVTNMSMRTTPGNAGTIAASGQYFRKYVPLLLRANDAASNGSDNGEFFLSAFNVLQWVQASALTDAIASAAQRQGVGVSAAAAQRELDDILNEIAALDREIDRLMADSSVPPAQKVVDVEKMREQRDFQSGFIPGLRSRISSVTQGYDPDPAFAPVPFDEIVPLLKRDEALLAITIYDDYEAGKERVAVIAIQGGAGGRARYALSALDLGEGDVGSRLRLLVRQMRCSAALADPDCAAVIAGCSPSSRGADDGDLCRDWAEAARPPFDFAAAAALYDLLIPAELRAHVAGRKLLISPDPDLMGLPFHLLLTAPLPAGLAGAEASRKAPWLFQSHPSITILPTISSLRDLREADRRPPAPKALVGFGDPVIGVGGTVDCTKTFQQVALRGLPQQAEALLSSLNSGGTPTVDVEIVRAQASLPDSRCELEAIAGLFPKPGDTSLFLGAEATEAQVKALNHTGALKQYRILHFATHAVVAGELGASNGEAGLILTPPARGTIDDDGLLTTSEIARLRLNADLVVLSACNTAAGNDRGSEALGGLAQAFFAAGARSLMVSHWPVSSPAAVDLTTRSFAALAANPATDRGEALVLAMRGALQAADSEATAHPSWWGAFVLVGNGAR